MDSDEMPDERCGFVLEPGDVPEHAQGVEVPLHGLSGKAVRDYEPGSDDWYANSGAVCCWREVWDGADDGRCIWHAESEDKSADELGAARANRPERLDGAFVPAADLGDAIDFDYCGLRGATFDGTGLQVVSFAGVDGWGAQFPDADLRWAVFPDADFHRAQFPDADLRRVLSPGASLRDAQFPDADLRRAQFPDADLRDAQFSDADLRGANFEGANMSLTTVGEAGNFDATTVFGWSHYESGSQWSRAARSYRAFQQTLGDHAMPTAARRYRIREMHMRRKAAFRFRHVEWAKLALARWTTEYGENPWRVTATAVAVIVGCALVYPFVGGVVESTVPADSTTHELQRVVSVDLALPEWATEVLVALYFSVVTFTTLGYGDLRPATAEAQAVATFESFVGALLMALLVYVLGRRVTT